MKRHYFSYLLLPVLLLLALVVTGCLVVHQKLPGTLEDVSKSPLVGTWVITQETNVWMDEEVEGAAEKLENDVMVFQPSTSQKECLMWVQQKYALSQQQMDTLMMNPQASGLNNKLVLCVLPATYQGKHYFQLVMESPSEAKKEGKPFNPDTFYIFRADISEDGQTLTLGTFEEKQLEALLLEKTKLSEKNIKLEGSSKAVEVLDYVEDPDGLMSVLATAPLKKAGVYKRSQP